MQNFLDILDKIRQRPAIVRRRITFIISLVAVVAFGALFLPLTLKENKLVEKDEGIERAEVSEMSNVEDLKAEVNKIGEIIDTLKEFKSEADI